MVKAKNLGSKADKASHPPADVSQPAEKKKRTTNPGVRVQGGRIYDSENGTTCHQGNVLEPQFSPPGPVQCRQKTAEVKAKCGTCTLYFCPKCLENRYGEAVEEVNKVPGWSCPRCRKLCNCSNCRKKQGLEATGQLAGISRTAGFGSVSDLLAKNPKAKALQLAASKAERATSKAQPAEGQEVPKKRRRLAEADLVEDALLGDRPCALPAPASLAVHKGGGGAGAKRQRGPAWLSAVPSVTPLREGVHAGELASVLEFVQVFAQPLKLRIPSLPGLAAELLQPPVDATHPGPEPPSLLCPSPSDSLVAHLHMRLIDVVREAWGFPTASSPSTWQPIMLGYFREVQASRQGVPNEGGEREKSKRGCGAAEGVRTSSTGGLTEDEGGQGRSGGEGGRQPPAIAGTELEAQSAGGEQYPGGGYWGVDPGVRVSMLYALSHDALDTYTLRNYIDSCMGEADAEEKERKNELAEVRKETREAAQQQRNKEIALLIAHASGEGVSAEQQRQLVEEARLRAEAAAAEKAAAKLTALQAAVYPPAVRGAVLGEDREEMRVYRLQAGSVLAGPDGLLAQRVEGPEGCYATSSGHTFDPHAPRQLPVEVWGCYSAAALPALAAALDPRGRTEGPLRHALISSCKLLLKDVDAAAAGAAKKAADKAGKMTKTTVVSTEKANATGKICRKGGKGLPLKVDDMLAVRG